MDSKPSAKLGLDYMRRHHEVAGMANSSPNPNVKFEDVGFDTILVAKFDLEKDTELFPKYAW
jgi:hypothetical protein